MSAALSKKICLLGDFAVGKTSLASRYVSNVFSEKYLTTMGVKIDTKSIGLDDGGELKLVIWDLAGTDAFSTTDYNYLRGADGYLLVADGTRRKTLITALDLKQAADDHLGSVPYVLLLNKSDLDHDWEISESDMQLIASNGLAVMMTSAKQGNNVEQAFQQLAEAMML